MKVTSFSPNLMVKSVNKSIEFYCNILGFSLLQTVPENGEFDWGMAKKDDFFIMFQKEESLKQEFYNKIHSHTNISHKMHKTFYGADEFAITDPDGFILVFSDTFL